MLTTLKHICYGMVRYTIWYHIWWMLLGKGLTYQICSHVVINAEMFNPDVIQCRCLIRIVFDALSDCSGCGTTSSRDEERMGRLCLGSSGGFVRPGCWWLFSLFSSLWWLDLLDLWVSIYFLNNQSGLVMLTLLTWFLYPYSIRNQRCYIGSLIEKHKRCGCGWFSIFQLHEITRL